MQQLNKFVPPVSNTIALLLLAFYVLVSIGVINAVQDYNF